MNTDKYIPIHNYVAEALAKINLSPYESRVLWVIFRKTYGFVDKHGNRKKTDWIAYSQITEMTGGMHKSLVSRSLTNLIRKGVISRDNRHIGFSKEFMKKKLSVEPTVVISRDNKKLSVEINTKETTKETIQKKERKETPLQTVVNHYKVRKGYTQDNKDWDREFYARCSKSAKSLLVFCGSHELACSCIDDISAQMIANKLTWTLETIVKHSADWKLNHSKKVEEERKKQAEVKKAEEFAKGMI